MPTKSPYVLFWPWLAPKNSNRAVLVFLVVIWILGNIAFTLAALIKASERILEPPSKLSSERQPKVEENKLPATQHPPTQNKNYYPFTFPSPNTSSTQQEKKP
ncbi:MAG: hypothetical protein N2035_07890 [Chthoniobacterales bacterium]|nr:hypothetical protein [Chthoniobacterales bacterium]MCX7713564.1 hypothetical protein [Chthoniobacterales bacterium]